MSTKQPENNQKINIDSSLENNQEAKNYNQIQLNNENTEAAVPEKELTLNDKTETEIDIEKFQADFNTDYSGFAQLQSEIIGEISPLGSYSIPQILKTELLFLPKTITKKFDNGCQAVAVFEKHKFYFSVEITKVNSEELLAYLKLVERVNFGTVFDQTFTEIVGTYSEVNPKEFWTNVKRAFNLKTQEEINLDSAPNVREYRGTPIELYSRLRLKRELLATQIDGKEDIDKNYLKEIIALLKKSAIGVIILKEFFKLVKEKELVKLEDNKYITLRQLLDKLILQAIIQNKFTKEQLQELAPIFYTAKENHEKIIASHAAPVQDDVATDARPKSAPAKTGGKSKGGGGGKSKGGGGKGGKGGGGGGGGKGKEKDKKKPFVTYKFGAKQPPKAVPPPAPKPEPKKKTLKPLKESNNERLWASLGSRLDIAEEGIVRDEIKENIGAIEKEIKADLGKEL